MLLHLLLLSVGCATDKAAPGEPAPDTAGDLDTGVDTEGDSDSGTDPVEDADGDGFATDAGDCDDADPSRYPGAAELCNEVDEDCDGEVDEDATDRSTRYADADGDTFGDAAAPVLACPGTPGTVADAGDCDDADRSVNPDAEEIFADGVDNNCDGLGGSAIGTLDPADEALATIYDSDVGNYLGWSVAVDDLDDDGTDDLVIARPGPSELLLFPGTITGVYHPSDAPIVLQPQGYSTTFATPGDMTGDGIADFVSTDESQDAVYLVAGPITASMRLDGGEAELQGGAGFGVTLTTPGDVDGDGLADLYVGEGDFRDASVAGRVYLVPGGVTGVHDAASDAPTVYEGEGGFATWGHHASDVDGDGVPDLLVTGSETRGHSVYLFLGPPAPGTVPSSAADGRVEMPSYGALVTAGDLDGDGDNDVVFEDEDSAYVLFAGPSGDVDAERADWRVSLIDSNWRYRDALAGVDFDGDGVGDLLLSGGDRVTDARLCVWYGPLTAGTGACETADLRYTRHDKREALGNALAAVGDVTGDGLPELLVAEYHNSEEATYAGAAYLLSLTGL